jgi:hypothetical protein
MSTEVPKLVVREQFVLMEALYWQNDGGLMAKRTIISRCNLECPQKDSEKRDTKKQQKKQISKTKLN